jgi:hypothetical protein
MNVNIPIQMSNLEIEERQGLVRDVAAPTPAPAAAANAQGDKMLPEMIEDALERAGLM